ncbi:MAG: virulence protein RhuM/Fic/DOC family protein [Bacteroidota bacterium]|nr:virulence protein RhuM/Fic/DOC family protein [Bacteroidota bacterium]
MDNKGEIIIYETPKGEFQIQVKLKHESLWLSQRIMAQLFGKDTDTIGMHIKNIYSEGELDEKATTEFFSVVQKEGQRKIKRNVKFYNLDVIISVGYRVNSKRGTQFRIWANKILKDYLIKGYAINETRLKEATQQFSDLKKTVKLLENVIERKTLTSDETSGLLKVITNYTHALDLLDRFDHQTLKKPSKSSKEKFKITYDEAKDAIKTLKKKFGGSALFGNEKDNSFKSSLENIYLTFQKKELYPGAERKAAHLLYFVVKNHSFTDGNKRIAAFLFIWFLERNGLLYTEEGFKKIEDNTLVALTLMIAESKSKDKEMIVRVILNLMQKNI